MTAIKQRDKLAGKLAKALVDRDAVAAALATMDDQFEQAVIEDGDAAGVAAKRGNTRQWLADAEETVNVLTVRLAKLDADIAYLVAADQHDAAVEVYRRARAARLAAQQQLPGDIEQAIADALAALDQLLGRAAGFRAAVAAEQDAVAQLAETAARVGVEPGALPSSAGDPLDEVAARLPDRAAHWLFHGARRGRLDAANQLGAAIRLRLIASD